MCGFISRFGSNYNTCRELILDVFLDLSVSRQYLLKGKSRLSFADQGSSGRSFPLGDCQSMKILRYIGVAFVTIKLACASAAWSENRPNLILFVADDQSVFDYGSYGNMAVPTPATDRFAKESLVFDCAFTGQAICAPVMCSTRGFIPFETDALSIIRRFVRGEDITRLFDGVGI